MPSYGKPSQHAAKFGKVTPSEIETFLSSCKESKTSAGGELSKRELYRLFCEDRGWRVATTKSRAMKATPVGNEAMPICSRSTFNKYVGKKVSMKTKTRSALETREQNMDEQNMNIGEDDEGGGTIGDFDDEEDPVRPVYEGNLETAEGRRAFYNSLTAKERQAWYKIYWDSMLDWATIYAGGRGLIE
jgi:hypothetical protein